MRLKIIAGNLLTMLVVGLLGYFLVKSQLETALAQRVDQAIPREQAQVSQLLRLGALEFTAAVVDRAGTSTVTSVFGALDEDGRRHRAFDAATGVASWFQDPARGRGGRPDIVVVTDNAGRVLARDTDPNRMFGVQLTQQLPGLNGVLSSGQSVHDAWKNDENKVLEVAIAPIRGEGGTVAGAMIVGYDVSNGVATGLARSVGRSVAFVESGHVYSSSLPASSASALSRVLEGPQRAIATTAMDGGTSSPFTATLDSDEFVAVASAVPMVSSVKLAFVVLGNRTEATQPARAANLFLYLTLGGLAMLLAYGLFVANSVLDPIEDLEEGVLAVINGQYDRRIEVDEEDFGGLAYRINQLIAMATGAGDEGGDASWADAADGQSTTPPQGPVAALAAAAAVTPAASTGSVNEPIDDPALSARLGAEPEDVYNQRLFQEYVAAKRAAGEDVSNIPQDRFIQRIQGNAKSLATRHGVPLVRFQVQVDGAQVILRPVLIR